MIEYNINLTNNSTKNAAAMYNERGDREGKTLFNKPAKKLGLTYSLRWSEIKN